MSDCECKDCDCGPEGKCEDCPCCEGCEDCPCCEGCGSSPAAPKEAEKLGLVDKLLAKAVSRKLLVFGTATALMVWSTLDPETWGLIAIVYVGGQSVVDAVKTYKHGGM